MTDLSQYRKNAQGNLVPIANIKPIDQTRDALVMEIVAKARAVNAQLAAFKANVFGDIAAFVQLSAEEYRVHLGGKKGNISLLSFDGRYKVLRAVQESITFDERLQAAKALIDECLHDWSEGASAELMILVNDAFRVDQAGNIRTGSVLALRRVAIEDPRWLRAMQAIGEAVQVVDSKSYIRVYERIGDTGEYQAIGLDVAGV